jgi:cell division septation protein DedD
MKFFKWLLYLLALSAFIWFVFFRPMNNNSSLTAIETENTDISENSEYQVEQETIADQSTIEDGGLDTDLQTENGTTNTETITNSTETTNKTATTFPEAKTNIRSSSINLNSKYLIVVGSFGKKSNADRMLRRVKKSGKDGVITKIRGLHRVVTASTDDSGDAKNLRAHFTHIYKEQAFVLEQ